MLFDALRQHTEDVYFIDGDNPYRFSFNGDVLRVFIANVHSASRSDSDEIRIQCPGNLPQVMRVSEASGKMFWYSVILGTQMPSARGTLSDSSVGILGPNDFPFTLGISDEAYACAGIYKLQGFRWSGRGHVSG